MDTDKPSAALPETFATTTDALSLVNAAGGRLTVCNKHGHPVRRALRQAARKGLLSSSHGGEVYTLNVYGREVLDLA